MHIERLGPFIFDVASVHIVVAHPAYTHTEVRHIQLLLLLHLSNCQGANAYSSGRFFGIMSQDVIHLFIYFNYDAYLLIVFLIILLLKMFHERYLPLEKISCSFLLLSIYLFHMM